MAGTYVAFFGEQENQVFVDEPMFPKFLGCSFIESYDYRVRETRATDTKRPATLPYISLIISATNGDVAEVK